MDVERLQQKRAQQPFRRNRWSSLCGVDIRKFSVEGGKHFVDDSADQAQRMVPRYSLLEVHIREQFTRPHIRTAHRCLPLFPPPAWNQIRNSMSAVHHTFFSSLLMVIANGAQGMIAKRKLPYAMKKERNSAREITLGLHPAAKR